MQSVRRERRPGRCFYALADVDKLLLTVQQSELVRGFGDRLSAKALELLAIHTDDVERIAAPPERMAQKMPLNSDGAI